MNGTNLRSDDAHFFKQVWGIVGCLAVIVAMAYLTQMTDLFTGPDDSRHPQPPAEVYEVVRVIDGDTFIVSKNETESRVRIIGIDTPEIGRDGGDDECFALQARTMLKELIEGKSVTLSQDPTQGDADNYGRLLRHVTAGGHNVAVQLLSAGAGREYLYDRDYVGRAHHIAAEAEARSAEAGLWSNCR